MTLTLMEDVIIIRQNEMNTHLMLLGICYFIRFKMYRAPLVESLPIVIVFVRFKIVLLYLLERFGYFKLEIGHEKNTFNSSSQLRGHYQSGATRTKVRDCFQNFLFPKQYMVSEL